MTISQYLKNIYTPDVKKIFFNQDRLTAHLFHAAGNRKIDPKKYMSAKPGSSLNKIFTGERKMPKRMKQAFSPFTPVTMKIFLEKYLLPNVPDGDNTVYVRNIMEKFGIFENEDTVNCQCFFNALIDQFGKLIMSEENDVEDIVLARYFEYKENPSKWNADLETGESTSRKPQYRYTVVIYEDEADYRDKLVRLCTAGNTEEDCAYYVDIPEHIAPANIIQEDASNEYDVFVIDLARPFMSEDSKVYTDFNYSGKDLYDELIKLRLQRAEHGPMTKTAFFIYSTMATEKTAIMFDYSNFAEYRRLTKVQQERMRDSVDCFFLNKETYKVEAVARRVRSYFDERFNDDYFAK